MVGLNDDNYFQVYIISMSECTLSRSWFTQSVSINVVWFVKKIKKTFDLSFDSLEKVESFLDVGLSSVLFILKSYNFDFDTFFKIQKPSNSIQNSISTLHIPLYYILHR
jgi:hypothetical protein